MHAFKASHRPPETRATRILPYWRASRRISAERALEASAFVTLILAWVTAYAVICPAEPAHKHHVHVAQVSR